MTYFKKISLFFVLLLCLGIVTSCGGGGSDSSSSTSTVSMKTDQIYEKGTDGIDDLPMLNKISDSELEALYGLKSSDFQEASVYISMMNVHATEIAIFKFSSTAQENAIDKAINKRLNDVDATWSIYLPDQYELVQNVKRFSVGNVKGFVIAEDASKIVSNINSAIK